MQAFDRYRIERLSAPPLILDPLQERHATEIFSLLHDPVLYAFVPEDPPLSLDQLLKRFRTLEGRRSPDGSQLWLNWLVRMEGAPAGLVQATCDPERKVFIAYEVFDGFRRRGIAVSAVRLMLAHLQHHHLADLVLAYVDTRNVASIGVLGKLGFSKVRLLEGADHFKGTVSDEFEFVRTMSGPAPF